MRSRGFQSIWWANAALAFLLELAALSWLAWWGWTVGPGLIGRLLLGVGIPLLAAVVWGRYASPRSTKLPQSTKLAIKAVVLLCASAALAAVAGWPGGLGFALLCLASFAFMEVGGADAPGHRPGPRG
jgi:hypothetical protein